MTDTAPASLEPINDDDDVTTLLRRTIGDHHDSLAGAEFRLFWVLDKPLTTWGNIQLASEVMWWVGSVDIILQLNKRLWDSCSPAGHRFLIDNYLSKVRAKTGGKTEMETSRGRRTLFETLGYSFGLDPKVIARNPEGLLEISEIKEFKRAIEEPQQYLLDLQEQQDDEDEEAA